MAEQLIFDLPVRPALGREEYFVSPANASTVATVEAWQAWPLGKLALVGPAQSGKTHLVHVWAERCGATIVAARDLAGAGIEALADGGAVAVEDADTLAGRPGAERALFHLHNLVLADGHPLLLTAQRPPAHWGIALPDLASRMQATAVARLDPPDDALLAAVLVKQFADRQLDVDPRVVGYLTRHMDRSFAFAAAVVDALDKTAMTRRKAITQPMAAHVLDKLRPDAR